MNSDKAAPPTDICPKCKGNGLVVSGTRSTGIIHDHTQPGCKELGINGGCGYYAHWKPQPPFVRQEAEPGYLYGN